MDNICDFVRYRNCSSEEDGVYYFQGKNSKTGNLLLRIFCKKHAEDIKKSPNHTDHKEITKEKFEQFKLLG